MPTFLLPLAYRPAQTDELVRRHFLLERLDRACTFIAKRQLSFCVPFVSSSSRWGRFLRRSISFSAQLLSFFVAFSRVFSPCLVFVTEEPVGAYRSLRSLLRVFLLQLCTFVGANRSLPLHVRQLKEWLPWCAPLESLQLSLEVWNLVNHTMYYSICCCMRVNSAVRELVENRIPKIVLAFYDFS